MPDYSKGKIYKIECNIAGEVYYGSTTQHYLCDRIGSHRPSRRNYSSRSIIERGNYNYKVIEYYPCVNKKELETQERWWIENNVCINKNIPTRTDKEYSKHWRETHKEYDKERRARYKEQNKLYEESMKEKIICECGCKVSKSWLREHKKTDIHKNKMLI